MDAPGRRRDPATVDGVEPTIVPVLAPSDFEPPTSARTAHFVLEPLGVGHNRGDFAAWTSSIDHIEATPGFAGRDWPDPQMSLEDNGADLARHAEDFEKRRGFTYTVLDPGTGEIIGCVYLYPATRPGFDVDVRSWVSADRADLDEPLYEFVRRWLEEDWPFARPDYAPR